MNMPTSKRAIAKEWLIFILLFPLGSFTCYALAYHIPFYSTFDMFAAREVAVKWYYHTDSPFDAFWNDGFGLRHFETFVLWLVPYLAVGLLRSILWSFRILRRRNDK